MRLRNKLETLGEYKDSPDLIRKVHNSIDKQIEETRKKEKQLSEKEI